MKRNIIGLILLIMILSGCDKQQDDPKFQPQINPNPKYFMTVKGNVDPELKGKVDIEFSALYETSNPVCEIWPNGEVNEGGVKATRNKLLTFKPKIDIKGNFLLSIKLDNYQEGFCKWNITSIYYHFSYKGTERKADANTAISFGQGQINKTNLKQIWLCKKNCALSQKSDTAFPDNFPIEDDYNFELKFKVK